MSEKDKEESEQVLWDLVLLPPGVWRLLKVGTPVEMSKEGKEGVPVRVFYTEDGKTTKMEFIN